MVSVILFLNGEFLQMQTANSRYFNLSSLGDKELKNFRPPEKSLERVWTFWDGRVDMQKKQ